MGINIAVVGATGNVGREILNILDEREFPAEEVVALASTKSVGKETNFGEKTLKVKALRPSTFPQWTSPCSRRGAASPSNGGRLQPKQVAW